MVCGATPGMWNWESAEKFDDSNGNGVWDVGRILLIGIMMALGWPRDGKRVRVQR